MDLLQGLHGIPAVALICGLLFIDEAGLPLPLAPSELLLLFAGLLLTTDGLSLWLVDWEFSHGKSKDDPMSAREFVHTVIRAAVAFLMD